VEHAEVSGEAWPKKRWRVLGPFVPGAAMTQGFKPLKRPTPAKGKSSTQAKPKVGKRIAPKKQSALSEAIQKRVRSTH